MAVVAHHFLPHEYRTGYWGNLAHNFNEGVNYFFFLSGFVMVLAYQKIIFQEKQAAFPKAVYWAKRVARIYPVYFFALVLTVAYDLFVGPKFSFLWQRLPIEASMLQTWLNMGSMNSPAWSVSCEVFFYFLFPFFILKFAAWKGKNLYKGVFALYATVLVTTALGWLVSQRLQQDPALRFGPLNGFITYHPFLRTFTFMLGTLGGIWFLGNLHRLERLKPYSAYLLLGSVLAVVAIYSVVPVFHNSVFSYGIMVPLYFVAILSLCNLSGRLFKVLSHGFCIFLGDISYGIYILQVPVQMYFVAYVMPTERLSGFLTYALALIMVSACSYFWLEKPMRNWLSSRLVGRLKATMATG